MRIGWALLTTAKGCRKSSREQAAELIRANALAWAVNQIESVEIDRIGISQAVRRAMMAAVSALQPAADALLLDWVSMKECQLPFQAVVKGDAKSLSIAAASILAKVERDSADATSRLSLSGLRLCPAQGLWYCPAHSLPVGAWAHADSPAFLQPVATGKIYRRCQATMKSPTPA